MFQIVPRPDLLNEQLYITGLHRISIVGEETTCNKLLEKLQEAFYFANRFMAPGDIELNLFVSSEKLVKKFKFDVHDSIDYKRVGSWIDINCVSTRKNVRLIPCKHGLEYLVLFRTNYRTNQVRPIGEINTELVGNALYPRTHIFNELVLHHFSKFLTDPSDVFDVQACIAWN